MFGDMLGNLDEQKARMKERLSQIKLNVAIGDGAVKIDGNASGEIENIMVASTLMASENTEELEDLLITAMNRMFGLIKDTEAKEANNMLRDILPPGMDHLLG